MVAIWLLFVVLAISADFSFCDKTARDVSNELDHLVSEGNYGMPDDLVKADGSRSVWPFRNAAYGDISSVAVHPDGEFFILHRGPNRWSENTFNESNIFQNFEKGAIQEDVLVGIDDKTGEQLHSWGRKRFYLPHSLTIDGKGNFWMTDVALHQVFKVDPSSLKVTMTLGARGIPGSDKSHFCKPTDVAVAADGSFFVADGYCNSRIIKFSPQGKYLVEFGRASDSSVFPGSFDVLNIPHSLALVENYDLICVANREDEKIQCFSAGLKSDTVAGKFVLQVAHPALSRVFAIHYSAPLNRLYAVNGMGFSLEDKPISIFSIDLMKNAILSWNPSDDGVELTAPHDLTLSNNGQFIYLADLTPRPTVWKFDNGDFNTTPALKDAF